MSFADSMRQMASMERWMSGGGRHLKDWMRAFRVVGWQGVGVLSAGGGWVSDGRLDGRLSRLRKGLRGLLGFARNDDA